MAPKYVYRIAVIVLCNYLDIRIREKTESIMILYRI